MDAESVSVVQVCSAREAIYGAVQSLLTLARTQRAVGDSVQFVTFAGKKFGGQVREQGFAVHEVRVRTKIDPLAIFAMRRIFKTNAYDVVHTHLSTSSVNGTLAARMAKIPCVATVHGMSGKMSFSAADHLIAVSRGVKEHLVRQGVPEAKVTVIYNGLEGGFEEITKEEARRVLGLAPDVLTVGTVSRITPLKGIDDALEAVAILKSDFPALRYLVVGDGSGLEACKAKAKELGIEGSVDFVGYREDIGICLAAMDLFVFPSHKEAMGIALVEAMAAGLPIVSTNVGGIPEVLTPSTGILVDPRQPKILAEEAKALLLDDARRHRLGEAARARAESVFSAVSMEQSTDEVYRKMMGAMPRAAISPKMARL